MYIPISTKDFKKSLKKIERSGLYNSSEIEKVINVISSGKKLDIKYQDHSLTGKMSIYRECHIKSDLLLVYQLKKDKLILLLVNIKNHSNFF